MGLEIPIDKLEGVYTALITPMHKDGSIEEDKLDMLIEDQIEAGITGILACGTTGQSASFTHKEQSNLTKRIADKINGRTQLIVNAGSNNINEAIYLALSAEDKLGSSLTFLAATGYYNKPPQSGIFKFYEELARNLGPKSNLIVYNVPGRTNNNIEPYTMQYIADIPNIIGVKEATDTKQIKAVIDGTRYKDFKVLSGEDKLLYNTISFGGSGVISATANIAPAALVDIYNLMQTGKPELAKREQEYIEELIDAVFSKTNPIPLAHMFETNLRLPLTRLDGKSGLPFDVDINPNINRTLEKYKDKILNLRRYKEMDRNHTHYF